ncbi:PH domain-containing protein [Balneolaceae bacterium YR4-1]|uniref:PH domain-containing protein n=1 Tax=Halalkalibaculum roseum TaxID=2709311 RepID=A0A6M1SN50_9BACT|nr:PH domain-containing protein [Halalkalibaculum roseum]NGP76479.1 PH domain-containing protein [Halalkalibaculum roseum]
MANKAKILATAEFNPDMKRYLLINGILVLVATIVGIVLIPIWAILAPIFIQKYFDRLHCELTTRSLRFEKGFIFHVERTIPLDKIQDLTFKEGPLLKAFGLNVLKIETAGNTGQGMSDLTLIGIIDAANFRNMVLNQRDNVTENRGTATTDQPDTLEVLKEIRDSLKNIEAKI